MNTTKVNNDYSTTIKALTYQERQEEAKRLNDEEKRKIRGPKVPISYID